MHKENLSAKFYLETTFSIEIQQNMKALVSEVLFLLTVTIIICNAIEHR